MLTPSIILFLVSIHYAHPIHPREFPLHSQNFSALGVGANNVLPYKDGDATSQVERHRRKRRSISEGVEPVHEMTCCERLYGLCEWIEPKTPGLREM